jgi:hypothetical protein
LQTQNTQKTILGGIEYLIHILPSLPVINPFRDAIETSLQTPGNACHPIGLASLEEELVPAPVPLNQGLFIRSDADRLNGVNYAAGGWRSV